jgi:hypothetical protein
MLPSRIHRWSATSTLSKPMPLASLPDDVYQVVEGDAKGNFVRGPARSALSPSGA